MEQLPSPLENISTIGDYEYYLQDGVIIIRNYNLEHIDFPLYNGIVLESIKLYIYLLQIINTDIILDMNTVMRDDLYFESIFLYQ